jgi:hypothetical protein
VRARLITSYACFPGQPAIDSSSLPAVSIDHLLAHPGSFTGGTESGMTTHGMPKPNRDPTRTMKREGGALSGDDDAGDRRSDTMVLRMILASFHIHYPSLC